MNIYKVEANWPDYTENKSLVSGEFVWRKYAILDQLIQTAKKFSSPAQEA